MWPNLYHPGDQRVVGLYRPQKLMSAVWWVDLNFPCCCIVSLSISWNVS